MQIDFDAFRAEKFYQSGGGLSVAKKEAANGVGYDKRIEYMQAIRKRIEEISDKLEKGDIEPSFQIGAASFTEREWDKLIESFDKAQEELRKKALEKQGKKYEKKESTSINAIEEKYADMADIELLVNKSSKCVYPAEGPEDKKKSYIVCYTPEGIFCKGYEDGINSGYLWRIKFTEAGQYERVINFIESFAPDANLTFVSKKDFWQDFLAGRIDENAIAIEGGF